MDFQYLVPKSVLKLNDRCELLALMCFIVMGISIMKGYNENTNRKLLWIFNYHRGKVWIFNYSWEICVDTQLLLGNLWILSWY